MDSSDPGVHKALAAPARRALLAVLTDAPAPLDSRQLADALELHVTTVRHHLTALAEAGLVEVRREEAAGGRGRPRLLYAAAPAREQLAAYQALVDVLSLGYGPEAAERSARAEEAGRAWGTAQQAAAGAADDRVPSDRALARQVLSEAEGWGFEPELTADGTEVLLHRCPFLQNAQRHPEVVCSVHQGLLDALAERAGHPGGITLHPFSAPRVCSVVVSSPPEPDALRPDDPKA